MLELALFILPGFIWYYCIYNNHDFRGLDSSQWILIPLLVLCSTVLFIISLTFVAFGSWICNFGHVCLLHYPGISLGKIAEINVGVDEFILAIALALFIPMIAKCRKSVGKFLNPFRQFDQITAIGSTVEALMATSTPIMLFFDDGRVYIGMPKAVETWSGDVNAISILPWMSGFVLDGMIKINGNYLLKEGSNLEPLPWVADSPISFLLKRVISIRGFNLEAFMEYYASDVSIVNNPKLTAILEEIRKATEPSNVTQNPNQ